MSNPRNPKRKADNALQNPAKKQKGEVKGRVRNVKDISEDFANYLPRRFAQLSTLQYKALNGGVLSAQEKKVRIKLQKQLNEAKANARLLNNEKKLSVLEEYKSLFKDEMISAELEEILTKRRSELNPVQQKKRKNLQTKMAHAKNKINDNPYDSGRSLIADKREQSRLLQAAKEQQLGSFNVLKNLQQIQQEESLDQSTQATSVPQYPRLTPPLQGAAFQGVGLVNTQIPGVLAQYPGLFAQQIQGALLPYWGKINPQIPTVTSQPQPQELVAPQGTQALTLPQQQTQEETFSQTNGKGLESQSVGDNLGFFSGSDDPLKTFGFFSTSSSNEDEQKEWPLEFDAFHSEFGTNYNNF